MIIQVLLAPCDQKLIIVGISCLEVTGIGGLLPFLEIIAPANPTQ